MLFKKVKNRQLRQIYIFNKLLFEYTKKIGKKQSLYIKYKQYICIKSIRKKILNKQKINFTFLIMNDSMNTAKPLIRKLGNDQNYNISIIVIPCMVLEKEKMLEQYIKTIAYCKNTFSNIKIIDGFDINSNKVLDISEDIDIVCTQTPYERQLHYFYRVDNFYKKNILPIHVFYGCVSADLFSQNILLLENEVYKYWKAFVDNEYIVNYAKTHLKNKGNNLITTGYLKMEELKFYKKTNKINKTIILAPHHNIGDKNLSLPLSTFLKFSDTYLSIIQKYPNISFVFRPHPLLKNTLESDNYWGKEKTKKYFDKINSFKNAIYQDGGDYLQTFLDSDGIITDCGSFLMEYLYIDSPGCYLLKNQSATDAIFNEFGQKCLNHYYLAYDEKDIFNYIDDVILNNNDVKKDQRLAFSRKEIKINIMNVTEKILESITKEIV